MIQLRHPRGPVTGLRATHGRVTKKRQLSAIDISFEKRRADCGGGVTRVDLAESNEGVHHDCDRGSRLVIRMKFCPFGGHRVSGIDPKK